VLLLLLAAAAPTRAQSGEAGYPTPVFSGEVSGRIAPRDVGDSRRTRHFYTFRGTEGDLVVQLQTSQLIGDVDVFTATTVRPLLKFSLLGDPAQLSKSFYLRKEETLVLRVEARAVGDAEGTYTIRFGGSFAPAPAELADAPGRDAPTLSAAAPRRGSTRRVTATGARIEEPKVEPTPVEEAREEARPAATPTPESSTGRRSTASRRRGTRNPPSRTRPGTNAPTTDNAKPETAGTTPAEDSSNTSGSTTEATPAPTPATPPRRRGSRTPRRANSRESAEASRSETPAQPTEGGAAEPTPTPPPVVTAQRLVIVLKDGETLERDMSGVRRVTVENNQVVIVGKDGRVTRRPLASVVRMSIEP
jgi:hypothetical protein